MNDTLIHACEMFLIPTTILFIAFALASTEKLKAVTSILGVITSAVWLLHIIFWTGILTVIDLAATLVLSVVFLITWVIVAFLMPRSARLDPNDHRPPRNDYTKGVPDFRLHLPKRTRNHDQGMTFVGQGGVRIS